MILSSFRARTLLAGIALSGVLFSACSDSSPSAKSIALKACNHWTDAAIGAEGGDTSARRTSLAEAISAARTAATKDSHWSILRDQLTKLNNAEQRIGYGGKISPAGAANYQLIAQACEQAGQGP